MDFIYRQGTQSDTDALTTLAIKSWEQFKPVLTPENWDRLSTNLTNKKTFTDLLANTHSVICTTGNNEIVGMAFLVPRGNPTDIFDAAWCYIKFLTVDPNFGGLGIGKKLTTTCINIAKQTNENIVALHTSEMMATARHIYESLGFKIEKEIDPRFGKRYWLYKLDLTNIDTNVNGYTNP